IRASISDINWRSDGHLLATALAADQTQRVDLSDGGKLLWSSQAALNDHSAAAASAVEASVQESFNQAPEIHIGDGRKWQPLTHRNAAFSNRYQAQSLSWKSDGLSVQGWLLLPAAASAEKLPMIVNVHGGPAGIARPRFIGTGTQRALLERGYAIFLPNPRGSFGQGEAFTQGNVKDFGGGDLRDILAGVDAVIKSYPVDPQRLGITGHSYGGFMTMWAVTQTQRFKVAVAGAGIVNWQSYYGQNGINEWMIPYFGASVYADPAVYAKSSPINFITRVKTPTFSFVGAADIECPAPQTQEFGRALQILGVPAMTVLYPGEGHAFRDPATAADIEQRTLAWFAKYLQK
ncbi:MAG TPA: prolyl oligopeptidase family serine peptidase, partial [Burkholderiaceae bacterium]